MDKTNPPQPMAFKNLAELKRYIKIGTECEISRDSGSSYFDYEPTENEAQLIKDMIAEKLMQTHSQTPQEFCEDVGDIMMGGISQ